MRATADGLICSTYGVGVVGFKAYVGECSVVEAELWGIYHGLYLAWARGWRCIELKVDSRVVAHWLCHKSNMFLSETSLARAISLLLSRDWIVQPVHIFREANTVVD